MNKAGRRGGARGGREPQLSLCWSCERAGKPSCEWMQRGVPVKGWMNERSEKVLSQFKKDYGGLCLKIITKDEMLSLQSNFKNKLWGWVEIR